MPTKSQNRRPELSHESLDDLSSIDSIRKQLAQESKFQVKAGVNDFFSQLMDFSGNSANDYEGPANDYEDKQNTSSSESGNITKDFIEGFEYQLFVAKSSEKPANTDKQEMKKPERRAEAAINYHAEIVQSGERLSRTETTEHQRQIEKIMHEIKKLVNSTKSLQMEFGHITVEEAPANPGKYYTSFFEWLLIMINQARQKIDDSGAWLREVGAKNSKKQGYWGKAKSMGTSFTQNNERAVATSTG
jgi:hypothetical protein